MQALNWSSALATKSLSLICPVKRVVWCTRGTLIKVHSAAVSCAEKESTESWIDSVHIQTNTQTQSPHRVAQCRLTAADQLKLKKKRRRRRRWWKRECQRAIQQQLQLQSGCVFCCCCFCDCRSYDSLAHSIARERKIRWKEGKKVPTAPTADVTVARDWLASVLLFFAGKIPLKVEG